MADFSTPLTALRATAKTQPYATAVKQKHNATTGPRYSDVSYHQFENDIEATASYWKKTFLPHDISEQSVIGVWLKGTSYEDLLHIWGIFRAGYTAQLILLRMTDPSVAHEVLTAAGAAALVHDPYLASVLQDNDGWRPDFDDIPYFWLNLWSTQTCAYNSSMDVMPNQKVFKSQRVPSVTKDHGQGCDWKFYSYGKHNAVSGKRPSRRLLHHSNKYPISYLRARRYDRQSWAHTTRHVSGLLVAALPPSAP
ncbi:hypothetical protein FOCG_12979 [Fusarium oxysporum f. sp. radicis-lycopersici 26381]|nr:hypothetical protein FOCG_12979 [Fusarium oxysporum f. sp. radicis-lycopersici 26381]